MYAFLDMCTWGHELLSACLTSNFHSLRFKKAHVCLFSTKPWREHGVGPRRLARPGTTPHRNVWNSPQQGLAHPCLLSLASMFVILSLHGLREIDGQTDRHKKNQKAGWWERNTWRIFSCDDVRLENASLFTTFKGKTFTLIGRRPRCWHL